MIIELTEQEQELLHSVLTSNITDIRAEIHHTDDYHYKEELRKQKEIFERLIAKINDTADVALN
ncbi:MAG: hypothetical protein AAB071_04065 [Bacteroidota bacterium]